MADRISGTFLPNFFFSSFFFYVMSSSKYRWVLLLLIQSYTIFFLWRELLAYNIHICIMNEEEKSFFYFFFLLCGEIYVCYMYAKDERKNTLQQSAQIPMKSHKFRIFIYFNHFKWEKQLILSLNLLIISINLPKKYHRNFT